MNVPVQILIFYIVSLVHVVELTNHQPCLICGDSVIRLWSMMSRVGDRYLRLTNQTDTSGNYIFDCAGALENDNFTSLSKIDDVSTMFEMIINLVFKQNNQQYHLYATSTGGDILAMPASNSGDNGNTWAPERLSYEHQLFTVFQSVKFRGYYLSCDGSGKAGLKQLINAPYREPNQLFLTVDPGNRIKGVAFDTSAGRRKREITSQAEANSQSYRIIKPQKDRTTKTDIPPEQRFRYAFIVRNFDLPRNIRFVLCFWVKTNSTNGQLMSVVEKIKEPSIERNIIDVSISRGLITLDIGYERIKRMFPKAARVYDGKFHQICISLNQEYLLELYQDGKKLSKERLPSLASDFKSKNNLPKRRGKFVLGQTRNMAGERFIGSLFQVNLWDQYPSFRIQRIATNCGCGGGSLVRWSDLLNGKMFNVNFDTTSECPKLEGYNYDARTQNRLI